MAKIKEIQKWTKKNHGLIPSSCWIAHCKELNGIPVKTRYKGNRKVPCPANKRIAIEDAFRHFKMI